MKLYFSPGACSFVPHTLLETAGEPFEPVLVKLHKGENFSPEYKAINPRSQVPVLVDGDQVITQIVAIVGHLADRFPQCGFIPRDPLARTRMLETLAWMNNTVHPTFTHIFMPQKFADSDAAKAELKAFNTRLYRGHLAELDALVARAQAQGKPYLAGDNFGPLDAYALTLARWGGIAGIDPTAFAATWAFVQRIAALPPVARAIERERLQLNLFKPA
ncbi:glutathione S-transferase family protein [Caenimonas terrae]|uniref:Glutathione S-transferase family protein n=1 Tax=Caenimonas terrae TaxID=696074 RepID=A0ABW0NCN9_9BURK